MIGSMCSACASWGVSGAAMLLASRKELGLTTRREAAPARPERSPSTGKQFFLLSAKTAAAAEQRLEDLASALESNDPDIGDVAFTLQHGRQLFSHRRAVVIDLPGTYSMTPISPDEEVVLGVIEGSLGDAPDALVVVADACTLERSLLVVAQVLRMGLPTCLVLTMVDELRRLFDAAGTRGELEIYSGVHHGFAFPERWCYDKPAAERHWERLHALYARCLTR